MRRRALQSTIEDSWAINEISDVTVRRNGKVAIEKYIQPPHKAFLQKGILSWTWTPPSVVKKRGKDTIHSTTALMPRRVPAQLWKDFLRLADADDQGFIAFAGRWGPLREPSIAAELPGGEPLDGWRRFARLARAVHDCALARARAQPGAAQDWQTVCKWLGPGYDPGKIMADLTFYPRTLIAQALNRWYQSSPGNSLIGWRGDKMLIEPSVKSLFGIIGVQLAYRIMGATEMLVCYHCERFFTPRRTPPTGRRFFCPVCRKRAKPQLYAMRDYRSRIKTER